MGYVVMELDRILEKEMRLTTVMGGGTPAVTLGSPLFNASKLKKVPPNCGCIHTFIFFLVGGVGWGVSLEKSERRSSCFIDFDSYFLCVDPIYAMHCLLHLV